MKRSALAVLLVVALAAPVAAEEINGQDVFDRHCVHCHADSKEAPGTLQLAKRRGADNAVLTERDDLVPAYIEVVVRNGLNAMPSFTPADLTEEKLQALVELLTR